MKQLKLSSSDFFKTQPSFGGELCINKRKSRRPLDPKKPLHLILRADSVKPVFLHQDERLNNQIKKMAAKFGIKIFESSINANHLHMVISFKHRKLYSQFVAALAGRVAQIFKIKWLHRPFTRIVDWGRALRNVIAYVIKNQKEAWGLIKYKRGIHKLKIPKLRAASL